MCAARQAKEGHSFFLVQVLFSIVQAVVLAGIDLLYFISFLQDTIQVVKGGSWPRVHALDFAFPLQLPSTFSAAYLAFAVPFALSFTNSFLHTCCTFYPPLKCYFFPDTFDAPLVVSR